MARNIKEPINYAFCFKETLCLQRRWEDLGYILQIWLNFTIVFQLIWAIKLFRSSRPVDEASVWPFVTRSMVMKGGWPLCDFDSFHNLSNRFDFCTKSYNEGNKMWQKHNFTTLLSTLETMFKPHNVLENRVYILYLGFYELDCSKKTRLYYSFWSLPTRIQEGGGMGVATLTLLN